MSRERERELAALTNKALRSVEIRRGPDDRIDVWTYRTHLQRSRSDRTLSHQAVLTYDIQVTDPDAREAMLGLLREELRTFIRNDKVEPATFAIAGGVVGGYALETVLKNIVRSAIVMDPEQAAASFYDSIEIGYFAFQEYFVLTGLRIEREISVFDGVTLIPLPNNTNELPAWLPRSRLLNDVDFLSTTVLRVDKSISPVLHQPAESYPRDSDPFTITIHSTDLADLRLDTLLQALAIVEGHAVQTASRWKHWNYEHVFNLEHHISSMPLETVRNEPYPVISHDHVLEAAELYRTIVELPEAIQHRLQVPLERWMKSQASQSYVDKMIDLGVAFEAFYLSGINEELSFRFTLRASLYLGESIDDRLRLQREFRELYRARSLAVHEGTLPDRITIDGQHVPIGDFIRKSQDLCRQSLMRAIATGHLPDWRRLELGEGQDPR